MSLCGKFLISPNLCVNLLWKKWFSQFLAPTTPVLKPGRLKKGGSYKGWKKDYRGVPLPPEGSTLFWGVYTPTLDLKEIRGAPPTSSSKLIWVWRGPPTVCAPCRLRHLGTPNWGSPNFLREEICCIIKRVGVKKRWGIKILGMRSLQD